VRRVELLAALADVLEAVAGPTPTRVAIDGRDAAGKTTLADELAVLLGDRGREVIRASIDDFHHSLADRHAQGDASADGYFEDAFDHLALWRELLEPLSPEGDRRYRRAVRDLGTDMSRDDPAEVAPDTAVLLLDGVFLLRPELRDGWDVTVFVTITPEETIRRARVRDAIHLGSPDAVERRYRARYLPAHERYDAEVDAMRQADLVVDNEDPANPSLVVRLQRSPLR
jgi:uridine kinase